MVLHLLFVPAALTDYTARSPSISTRFLPDCFDYDAELCIDSSITAFKFFICVTRGIFV